MIPSRRAATRNLLPIPRELQEGRGACRVGLQSPIALRFDDARIERALSAWRSTFAAEQPGSGKVADQRIRVAVDRTELSHPDGYRLTVATDGIDVLGGSPAGCFHAIQTLTQLSQFDTGEVPCCTVWDHPDFATRGLLHDVTRGKVPTLDTLKMLVDRLVILKVNQLQLNIEHAFAFSFDPEICGPRDGLTPGEMRELDAYCRERFIDLVPAVATLGHMGRILSMPKYRHLAEIEARKSWAEMTWPQRLRGLTLDCANREAYVLIERMWSDILDAFSSPVVNICGDEPWDLGQGKNRRRFAARSKGEPYVEHVCKVHDICAARGRRAQFWSDVVRKCPHLLDTLPRDSTVLHWGYDEHADYGGTAGFTAAGLDTFVCPGTSGWKRIINAMGLAERNIAAFASAGLRHGASGLLNTDWGDHGHFNLLACSWHGIALGAALGWNANHPTGAAFDELFARVMWDGHEAQGVALLRAASAIADRCETWRLMWMPLRRIVDDPMLPTLDEATQARRCAREALRWCKGTGATDEPSLPTEDGVTTEAPHGPGHCRSLSSDRPPFFPPRQGGKKGRGGYAVFDAAPKPAAPRRSTITRADFAELAVACRFSELFADKVILAHVARDDSGRFVNAKRDRLNWARRIEEAAGDYARCWRARNKESGLGDVLAALEAAADDIRVGDC